MGFATVNPFNAKILAHYEYASAAEIERTLTKVHAAAKYQKNRSLEARQKILENLARQLRAHKLKLARSMAVEMGKPVKEGEAEVEKSALACLLYAQRAQEWLASEGIHDGSFSAEIITEPLGVIFAIMPWNFPIWQVIRCAAPAVAAGNAVLLKGADITAATNMLLQQVFTESAEVSPLEQILLRHEEAAQVIADPRIRGVTFTGSTGGGKAVALEAGKNAKKVVLELGGSDAYLVLKDADVDFAARTCAQARLVNGGQSCVAAKRFFVHESVHSRFMEIFTTELQRPLNGDPLSPQTDRGPLAAKRFQHSLHQQVQRLLTQGQLLAGGILSAEESAFYPATVLAMSEQAEVWTEELFGPVACVWKFVDEQKAIELANNSIYGLGGAVFSSSRESAKRVAVQMDCGIVALNDMVRSDPRAPFGGVKESGFGRELSHDGLREFVNVKSLLHKL